MQDYQLLSQPGGSGNNSGGDSQRGQRKEQPINPGGQREEARTNDDTQRRGGELIGKTDDIFYSQPGENSRPADRPTSLLQLPVLPIQNKHSKYQYLPEIPEINIEKYPTV